MMNTTFFKKLTVVLVALFFASCDKDYNSIGSDIVGNEHFDFTSEPFALKVYNQKIPAVQSNNIPVGQLGIISNTIFGKTKADFVTQLVLATQAPEFKSNVAIDSVVLTIPYFSTKISTDSDGRGGYTLDSIQGSGPINLQVYRNGFTLVDHDPSTNFATPQKYFTNQQSDFDNHIASAILNNDPNVIENTAFVPSNKEYKKYKVVNNVPTTEVESRSSPRMRLHLDKTYFKTNIIDASADKLVNNNAFKAYFKGLYFKVGNTSSSLMTLDFSKGDVTIYYKQDKVVTTGPPSADREMKNLTLSMASGYKINLLQDSEEPTDYTNAGIAPNQVGFNAKKLYLKGGQGSMALVELFTDDTKLDELIAKKPLVNDASLTFTVDKALDAVPGYKHLHPMRVYLFDVDNGALLYDYIFDGSTNVTNNKLSKSVFGGILENEPVVNGKRKYRIRITEHVNNILKDKTKNVRLGLVVTENISYVPNMSLRSELDVPNSAGVSKKIKSVPMGSVVSTAGTILHGIDDADPANNVKFEIHYTKPN